MPAEYWQPTAQEAKCSGGLKSIPRSLHRSGEIENCLDNQVRFQRLDEAVVETYADAVNRGDRFPAILVRREERSMSDWTANHLFAAYARNQRSGIPSYDVFVSGMQATVLAFRANVRYGVPNTEDERLSHAFDLMDSDISLAQATAVCMVSERALRTRWNKRQADRRADEVGLLRNEWGSLLPAVRGRLLMIATNEGFRAAAMLAHRARLSTSAAVKLVSEVNGTKSLARQAAMFYNIDATVYFVCIRDLSVLICPVG